MDREPRPTSTPSGTRLHSHLVSTLGKDSKVARVYYALRSSGMPANPPKPLRNGVHTRGYLPHIKREGASYFVTFRLHDSLPKQVLLEFRAERDAMLQKSAVNKEEASEVELEYRRKIERYLDKGHGSCELRNPAIAKVVADGLRFFHGQQYLLDDWVIMPNHVHLILWPMHNHTLTEILSSRKSRTSRAANLILGRTGNPFWQHESYDHWIRNDEEKERIRRYIRNNPVKAGLCRAPEEWSWGSAFR